MDTASSGLTQAELLALAVDAAHRGDDGRSIAYLKQSAIRPDATAEVFLLLGSQLAQLGLIDEAFDNLGHAVELAPNYSIARFQLGLLHLTNAQADQALAVWAPLRHLPEGHPLRDFRQGLEHLINDEFAEALACLERGIAANTALPPLNTDMALLIDRIHALRATKLADKNANETVAEEPASHLFLSAYGRDNVH